MRRSRAAGWMAAAGGLMLALGAGGCATPMSTDVPERMGRGPRAEEMFYARVYATSAREPNFDERRQHIDRMDDRVVKYLREQWRSGASGLSTADLPGIDQLRAMARLLDAAYVEVNLENNYIRFQGKAVARY